MVEKQIRILWVDDEIMHLKAHLLYLEEKGFSVDTSTNGMDALDMIVANEYDLVFLDENMPGLSGLQTLTKLKETHPELPVVMITKSEEEDIMDQAIGSKISDYLIKPVNPNQIVLTIKKILDQKRLVSQKITSTYQSKFTQITLQINDSLSFDDWMDNYRKLTFWELELEAADGAMDEVLKMQKAEANREYAKFIKKNYVNWIKNDGPLLSHQLFRNKVFPLLDNGEKVFFILIDNFRFDQWQMLRQELTSLYSMAEDTMYCSILPTATQYARNAIFSGLMPAKIVEMFPQYWVEDEDEGSKNQFEEELIKTQIARFRRTEKVSYHKISDHDNARKLTDNYKQLLNYDLNVVVYNFIDMLSHARTEMKMIKELAGNESAYRSLTRTWYLHSPLKGLLEKLANEEVTVVITTDHGTIRVNDPIKVVGDKTVNTNLRYKQGKNLAYNVKEVFEVKSPEQIGLPRQNVSSTYIFATNDDFFAYPNNFNYYANHYRDTFQHGGISMEEMMIPFVVMNGKKT